MKKSYDRSIQLRCAVCGSANDFEYNEDKTYIKCKKCNKEYSGEYDELVELNQAYIHGKVYEIQQEVQKDSEKGIKDMFDKAFNGNINVKIK